jgi:hypothetical protein
MNRNAGFNFSGSGYGGVPTFYNIKSVDNVYQLVNNLRRGEASLNN